MIIDELKKAIDYFSENSSWIKDSAWIAFTLIATIVAILTYKNAKKTIFQPLNTEVIKHQTEVFVNLYNRLKDNLIHEFDYYNIFFVNFFAAMEELKIDVTIPSVLSEELKRVYDAGIPIVMGKPLSNNNNNFDDSIANHVLKVNYQPIEEGKEIIFLKLADTKVNRNLIDELSNIIQDPFIPQKIKTVLTEMYHNAIENCTSILSKHLTILINKIWLGNDVDIMKEAYHACNEYMDDIHNHIPERKKLFALIKKQMRIDKLFK